MAGLAGLREAAMVHVGVAVCALTEWDSGISWLPVGAWRVTFFALHWDVLPGKGIARLTVVELSDGYGLPIGVIVAL